MKLERVKGRFGSRLRRLMCLGCGLSVAGSAARADVPLPAINTNNIIVVTNAPYNALGDGVTTNTVAIQNAINAATLGGTTNGLKGGTVKIPAGVFLCGPLTMKSFVNLQIDAGATLRMLPFGSYPGGTSPTDFISASKLRDIEISGPGMIDGQGLAWWQAFEASGINRPKAMFAPSTCTNVLVQNVTLQSPPNTHISLRSACRNVTIQAIVINTTSDVLSDNTDGIDVNAVNCLIQNCAISDGDDHIAIGGGSSAVVVTNCIFGNGHGISIGSHTDGGFSNFLVCGSSMTIADSASLSSGIRMKSGRDRGGFVHDLTYLNVALTNVQNPIFISSYYPDNTIPASPASDTGSPITALTPIWRDITISNVTIVAPPSRNAGRVYGLPEMLITNLTLMRVSVQADKSFEMYHVANARFVDTQINLPAAVNTFSLYDVDLTVTNGSFNPNLIRIGGWAATAVTNRLSLFNARAVFADTNVLPHTPFIALGGATLTVSNDWFMDSSQVVNLTLGSSNATIVVTSNLTVSGTVNVAAGPGFTNGAYTVFTCGRTLSWGNPTIGAAPTGFSYSFDTNTAGQVKLIVGPLTPGAPANPSATGTNLSVRLNWSGVSTATGYRVKRSTDDGGPYAVIGAVAATNFSDTTVLPGAPYYYVIAATNSAGEGPNSVQVSAVPLPSTTPTNLNFQMTGNLLHVSWPPDHRGWHLEIQTNTLAVGLGANWVEWPGSRSLTQVDLSIGPANGSVLMRLVYP